MHIVILIFLVFALVAPALAVPSTNMPIISSPAYWDTKDREAKIKIIAGVIEEFKRKGITIRKEPAFYVDEIDINRSGGDPGILTLSISEHFKSITVLYRDFENGQDPEAMIQESLGDQNFQIMKDEGAFEVMEMHYQDWKKVHAGIDSLNN